MPWRYNLKRKFFSFWGGAVPRPQSHAVNSANRPSQFLDPATIPEVEVRSPRRRPKSRWRMWSTHRECLHSIRRARRLPSGGVFIIATAFAWCIRPTPYSRRRRRLSIATHWNHLPRADGRYDREPPASITYCYCTFQPALTFYGRPME